MKILLIIIYNYIWNYILRQNNYWKEKKYIIKLLPKNPIILEAGSHVGSDTIKMALAWKNVIIHAFEPVPDVYKKLHSKAKFFNCIKTYPLALSNVTGQSKIFVSQGTSDASSSLLPPKEHLKTDPGATFEKEIIIDTITIDDWAKANNIQYVDFLWLDMQGYELAALKSGENILKTVKAIYTEVFFKELYEDAPLYAEVKTWLESRGFRVEKEELDWEASGNVLFVKADSPRK